MNRRWGYRGIFVGVATCALVVGVIPAARADAVTTCTLAQLIPQLADSTVIQGIGSINGSGGYSPLSRGKETLVRFYLTLPSPTVCTVNSTTQSIKVTSASLIVDNSKTTSASVAYNAFGTAGQSVAATMQPDWPADPLFVVAGADLAPTGVATGFTAR